MIGKVVMKYAFFAVTNVLCFIWVFFFSSLSVDDWVALIWKSERVATLILNYVYSSPPFITLQLSLVILSPTLLYNHFVFSAALNKFVWLGGTHFWSHYLFDWLTYVDLCHFILEPLWYLVFIVIATNNAWYFSLQIIMNPPENLFSKSLL